MAVDSVRITNCSNGLYTDGSSAGSYSEVDIRNGGVGLTARSIAAHTFRSGNITGFTSAGVSTFTGAGINLGVLGNPGLNNIYTSSPLDTFYVKIKPNDPTGPSIMAIGNWWGASPPPSNRFPTTGITYLPARTTIVPTGYEQVEMVAFSPKPSLVARPNPFVAGVALEFSVGEDKQVDLAVFDVSGRLVQTWNRKEITASVERFVWDGNDAKGRRVPAGIYFVRGRVGSWERVVKLVRISH